MAKLRHYTRKETFNPDHVKSISAAAVSIANWVLAIDYYCEEREKSGNLEPSPERHAAPTAPERQPVASALSSRSKEKNKPTASGTQPEQPQNHDLNEDVVKKGDVQELKAFNNPPELVKTVLSAVCILFGTEKPDWMDCRRLLADQNLLKNLIHYDKDNVPQSILA